MQYFTSLSIKGDIYHIFWGRGYTIKKNQILKSTSVRIPASFGKYSIKTKLDSKECEFECYRKFQGYTITKS